MGILKTVALSIALFVCGSFICILAKSGPLTSGKATGISALKSYTFYNPAWWAVAAGAVAFMVARAYLHMHRV